MLQKSLTDPVENLLASYQKRVDAAIVEHTELLGPNSPIREACLYALKAGGKRIRPAIVLMTAKSRGHGADATHSALAIEYFHTASLVVDDLPVMDDDDLRRNQPSTHKVFGESAALLTSYALISAGYMALVKNAQVIRNQKLSFSHRSDEICSLVVENAAFNTGLYGATGGQFLDLNPPNLSISTIKEIIHKKTTSLFEISFVSGWLYGGGDSKLLPLVKEAASHFGLAFQLADDLDDMAQDKKNGRVVNVANAHGKSFAQEMFHVEHKLFVETISRLGLNTPEFQALSKIFVP